MDVYFPHRYVAQADLEEADGIPKGKYEIGLGQERMSFVGDREDVNSIMMTAVSSLLTKFGIAPEQIGRLEVGTETLIDKSKSAKTHLMDLLGGNTNVEGCTSLNACYGGTAALLNSVAWVESSAWDGRYALVVCGDIAVYEKGPARPTGGCGAVAMLIGPDSPLPISAKRYTHAEHAYDFYKPNLESEYAMVDGHLSNMIYLRSLDVTYNGLLEVMGERSSACFDFLLFHSPYNKLVSKAVGRCLYNDFVRSEDEVDKDLAEALAPWKPDLVPPSSTYADRGLDKALKQASAASYKEKCAPGAYLSKQIGNSYTGALYVNLAALLHTQRGGLEGKSAFCFSYGSGAVATTFSIAARAPTASGSAFTCEAIADALDLNARLSQRQAATPEEFATALTLRETTHSLAPYTPSDPLELVSPGAYYIEGIDERHHRTYRQRPH